MLLQKYEICIIWILLSAILRAAPQNIKQPSVRRWVHRLPVTWVGVLSYKERKDTSEAIAGIILINTKVALGNAIEVSIIKKKRIRETTKAMFLDAIGNVWQSTVTDYILHPEFDEDTLNTLALIILEYDTKKYKWKLMEWPSEVALMNEHKGRVYFLGHTDRNKVLEQEMYRMAYVNRSACDNFYKNEQLDSKWMNPTEFECFKVQHSSEQCVFNSGMALAVLRDQKWTLIGMSVLGPGCSLPNRFIDFARYVHWIEVTTKSSRRYFDVHETRIPLVNYDKIIMEKLYDDTLVMRPYKGTHVIHGNCDSIDGAEIYQESSWFNTPSWGVGLYGLSIWDKKFQNVSCAMLQVKCTQRSIDPFSFNFGLLQFNEDLTSMIKSVPISQFNRTAAKTIHLKDGPWIKWWYRTPDDTKVSSVVFKFEFYKEAMIQLKVFGPLVPKYFAPTKAASPTEGYNRTRSRRPWKWG